MSLPYCEYFYINVLSTYKSGYKLKQKKKKKIIATAAEKEFRNEKEGQRIAQTSNFHNKSCCELNMH